MCTHLHFKVHYWPALTSIWFALTFLVSYTYAVFEKHVYYFLPLISDTGTTPPESCIFGEMLSIGSLLWGITIYVRHRQVRHFRDIFDIPLNKKWIVAAEICGVISVVGITLIGNFQRSVIHVVHALGASMAFGVGSIYFIIQTRITYAFRSSLVANKEIGITRQLFVFRAVLSFFMLPLVITHLVGNVISKRMFDGESILYWTEKNKGFSVHLTAALAEWIVAAIMMLYVVSFTKEFKAIRFKEINLEYIS